MADFEMLVNRIYEAAAFSDDWSSVLHDLAAEVDSVGGVLLTRRNDAWTGWRCSPGVPDELDDYLRSDAAARSETTSRLMAADRAGFVADHELFSPDEYLTDPSMVEFGARNQLHHGAATLIAASVGDHAVIQVQRRVGQPRFDERELSILDRFRPHLARATMLATRWRLERLRSMTQALELIGIPAAVLDDANRVSAANALIQLMTAHIAWLPGDGIALVDPAANMKLRRVLAEARHSGVRPRGTFPAIVNRDDRAIVHLVPITLGARDLFDGGHSLLVVTRVEPSELVDATIIRTLFDLTQAEATVAKGIGEGLTTAQIAARQGVSSETIRTQTSAVFAKTGCHRRSELVALLGGLNRIRPG